MWRVPDRASWVEPNDLFPNADWRVLLPDPDPAPSLVAALGDGPTASIGRQRLGASATGRTAMLAIGDGFDPAVLRSLRSRLAPGGVAYVEGDTSPWRGIARTRRAFLANGFDDVVFYASSPASSRWDVSWWIPIGSSAAIRFAAAGRRDRRSSATASMRSRLVRFVYRLLHAAPRAVRLRPWLLHPMRPAVLCAVAVVADPPRRADPTPGFVRDLTISTEAGGRARSTLLVRAGGSSTDQAIAVVFAAASDTPVAVVKVASRDEEVESSRRDFEMLGELATGAAPVEGVPVRLGSRVGRGFTGFAQSFLPGRPVAAIVRPGTVDEIAAAMTAWAIALAQATTIPVDASWGPGVLQATLGELEDVIGTDVASPLYDALAEPLAAVATAVTQHRDLGPWNVHLDGDGRVGVFDWEDAIRRGVPLADLVHHLVHLELCAHDAYADDERGPVIHRFVSGGSGSPSARSIEKYAAATGLGSQTIPALRVLTWLMDLARQEPAVRGDSIYLNLLLGELRIAYPGVPLP